MTHSATSSCGLTGTSFQWRPVRVNLFKCKYFWILLDYTPHIADRFVATENREADRSTFEHLQLVTKILELYSLICVLSQ